MAIKIFIAAQLVLTAGILAVWLAHFWSQNNGG